MVAIFLFLLITHFSTTIAQERNLNISLGSSLSPKNNSYWLSSSGQFAFGFYKIDNGFAIGIWMEAIQRKTVIWTANRDDPPLPQDVNLSFSSDGMGIFTQNQIQQTTVINAPQQSAFSASMLDTGNFVLYNSSSMIIWQSFDFPTDTMLPGQRLLAKKNLVSSISETNHGSGKFQLIMQVDGNLVQYPASKPKPENAYWNSETSTAGEKVSLNLDGNGRLYLLNTTTGLIVKDFYGIGSLSNKTIYRLTIGFDGILRLYSHRLNQGDDWVSEWSPTSNRCDPTGLCGPNSYCTLLDQEPICTCPPGFGFIDQEQKILGCKRDFSTDGCISTNRDTFSLRELERIAWEDNAYSNITSSKADCREDCLMDCNCDVVLFKDQLCRKQMLPLRYGRIQDGDQGGTTIIKVGVIKKERKKHLPIILFGSVTILVFALIVLAITSIFIYRYRAWKNKNIENDGLLEDVTLRSYTYAELDKATNGFLDELGRGAFGTVFKGVIPNGRRVMAIKRLENVVAEGEREFRNEMKAIGRTYHKNLVKLYGYCHDGNNRLLVYEYMSNGSLAKFLFESKRKPSWEEKTRIALNVARGILYLHEECETQIIHCDIKPENILMDEHKCAKIADFGLAKLLMPNQTRTYTGIRGTRGYVAPEWHGNLPITAKADVYSFGIMLFEIICGRRHVDMDLPEDEVVLANWVYDCFQAGELDKLVKDEEVERNKLERMVRVGLWCIQDEPSLRPPIKKVVLMLEGTVEIPAPPSPTSFLSSMEVN
ncbi:hypothetical protein RGQ29_010486 [Quercus rubra]|uniref:Receptor-like serine/threonine-protein kinase n=1 Tax=Quercus rubra TaxID=3512 RepID=A0AAN7FYE2_QUERU|nr:hypothetical protein RGQ29_010486 [Quercus rubra]